MSVVYLAPEIIGAMNEDQKTTFNKLRTWSMKVGRVLDIPSQTERSSRMIEKFLEQSDSLGDEVDSAGFEQEVSQALSGQIANLVKELSLVEPASSQGDEESKIDRVDLSTFEAFKYMQMLVPTVPSFDGDITKFGEFRSLFDRAVHNVPNLPDEIKYQVLRDKLVGDARNSLSSYKSDGSDYLALYSSLVAENSGKYRLARKTFADMTGIPPIRSPEVGQVEKFLAAARSWLRAMEEIDTENLAAFLMFEALFSRIDPSLAEKFNRVKTQELDSVPSAADLIQFLEGELSLIRMMPASSNPPNPGPHRYSSSKRPSGDVEPTRSANSFPNSSFKRFKSEPKPSRIAFVLQSKICINCFSFRYTLEGCPSERRCHCGERHHALVHQDPERPSGALKVMEKPNQSRAPHK